MKTFFASSGRRIGFAIQTCLSVGSLAVAALLFSGSAQTSLAASADPSVGSSLTWDMVSSGSGQRGMAVITFSNNSTFHGYQMWASVPPNTNSSIDNTGRGGGDTGRGTGGSSGPTTNTFVFGFSPIDGFWTMNLKQQIVGFFSVALNVESVVTNYHATTVFETITNAQTFETTGLFVDFAEGQATATTSFTWSNPPGFVQIYIFNNPNFTISVGSAEQTNSISFVGTSRFARTLTLVCSTSFGKVTYKGVPTHFEPDLSGSWFGTKHENGQQFNEFFDLVSFSVANPFASEFPDLANFPNIYFTTDGVGPGYTFTGIAMISAQKQIGFRFLESGGSVGNGMRASIGKVKATKKSITGQTKGIQDPLLRMSFDAGLLPSP